MRVQYSVTMQRQQEKVLQELLLPLVAEVGTGQDRGFYKENLRGHNS